MRRLKWLRLLLIPPLLGVLAGLLMGKVFHIPRVEGVQAYTPPKTTILYDRNNHPFATYAIQARIPMKPGELPFLLKISVLAAEDASFYHHGGIHPKSILRALIHDIRTGHYSQGGSTITQQLARRLFLKPKKKLKRKIEEALLAFDLEKRLTKEEILTLYCNLVYLGNGSYGMASAARRYFNKRPDQLQIHQAALLAGLPQLPNNYNPLRHPKAAMKRRNWVIRRLAKLGYLTQAQSKKIQKRPLDLNPPNPTHLPGQYFAEEVRRMIDRKYGTDALYKQGLAVQTTMDATLQRVAEGALKRQLHWIDYKKGYRHDEPRLNVLAEGKDLALYQHPSWKHLSSLQHNTLYWGLVQSIKGKSAHVRIASFRFTLKPKGYAWTKESLTDLVKVGDVARFFLREDGSITLSQIPKPQGAVVILDNTTGNVLALVGGYDYAFSEFNRATQAKRQTGSAFKPFIYATALEQGWSWAETLFDGPIYLISETGEPDYSPENYYKKYFGIVTLREALEHSLNVCAVKLFLLVKPANVIRTAHECGIDVPIQPYASSALGATEITPIKLTAAYTVFPNLGTHVDPILVTSVTRDGILLQQSSPTLTRSLHPAIAGLMVSGLEGVVTRGTAASAHSIPLPLAGKTGTTNDYTDAWFIGFSPSYTVGVWIGNEQKTPLGKRMPGATAALPVFKTIMKYLAAHKMEPVTAFTRPPGLVTAAVDGKTGLLATPTCHPVIKELFLPGTQPRQTCSNRWHTILSLPYYEQASFYKPKVREIMGNEYTDRVRKLMEEGYFEEKEKEKEKNEEEKR